MGQTLTHGIYLPDEGERNCYNGLAGNWQMLDGAVGTIAEHTTQIAGKAPAVHTHTKSDITDFPAYGNAAGTICEGNDSRLSDARTPVAHTHTKSDVTDLLNSNFIPSANNSYDLGSSSYQWNNLYAKNYYYNGVAWGLDKMNYWTDNQKIKTAQAIPYATNPSAKIVGNFISFCDNNFFWGGFIPVWNTDGSFRMELGISNYTTAGAQGYWTLATKISKDFGTFDFYTSHGNSNLGTSTNKWKTLNGVNPGALSLPDLDNTYRWSLDTTNWVLDGSANNTFTPNFSGWLNIRIPDVAGNYIIMQSGSITVSNQGTGALASTITRPLSLLIPVIEGVSGLVRVNAASITGYFYPALGNPIKTTQPSS